MKITILQVGLVPDPLRQDFPSFAEMMQTMLNKAGGNFDYQVISIVDDDPLPPINSVEALLITGSAHGIYDPLPWIKPLKAFIRDGYARHTPMVGICFGHQIMAEALGGRVAKSDKGWGIGRQHYCIENLPAELSVLDDDIYVTASHQDQVLAPPQDAIIFARSGFTPNAGLYYPKGPAISVQPHPEFEDDFAMTLFESRKGTVFSPDAVNAAIASMERPSSSASLARFIVKFFDQT